jgi:ferrous iron transport protein A
MMPLSRLGTCTAAVVVSLPRPPGLARRLISLGLVPGAEVTVLQDWGRGPLIVEVHGSRLALGRGQAARVGVEPLASPRPDAGECASSDYPTLGQSGDG